MGYSLDCASLFCVYKQKTAYEMRISDWSSDVCSSYLCLDRSPVIAERVRKSGRNVVIVRPVVTAESMITIRQHRAIGPFAVRVELTTNLSASWAAGRVRLDRNHTHVLRGLDPVECAARKAHTGRSEEHTSELQSLMRISYAVFCL